MTKRLSRRGRVLLGLAALGAGIPTVALASVHLTEANSLPTVNVPTLSGGSTATTAGSAAAANSTSTTSSSSSSTGSTGKGMPADKVTVTGSNLKIFSPNQDVVILQGQMKTSSVADLLLSVTTECSILTSVTTVGNDSQTAQAHVVIWVTIDGQTVGVDPSQPGGQDNGPVTFCNRVYSSTTSGFASPMPVSSLNPTITSYQDTKDANAFNWAALNVGNQVHTIQVHAELFQAVTSSQDQAQAYVGARTLVVNTTQTAQNQAS